jgi:recombination protein RecT
MTTKELTTKLTSQLESYEKKVFNDLLKTHQINPSAFTHIVLTEIKKSPEKMSAFVQNPASLFASVIFAAQLGLMPSDELGQFYMIPFNIKNKGMTIKPIIGYQGMVSILLRGDAVKSISAESVHEGDEFDYALGLYPRLDHKPIDPIRNAQTLTHVYVVVEMNNGSKQFKVMSRYELLQVINILKTKNDLYFSDKDPNFWMLKKIVLKQISKTLPKDYLSAKAIKFDDNLEGGKVLTLDDNDEPIIMQEQAQKQDGMFADVVIED